MSLSHQLAKILHQTRELLARPNNDFTWSRWSDKEEALREFDALIELIRAGDNSRNGELELLFAPTSSLQEVSINSGWGDEFLSMAATFDTLIKQV